MKLRSFLIKIFLSLALLAVLAMQIDTAQLLSMAANIHPLSWLFAIGFILLQILFLSVRWVLLVNAGRTARMNLMTSIRITSVSFLANYLFITSLGGIIARIGLTMNHGFPFVKSLTATVIDRAFTLLALVILAGIFMPLWFTIVRPEFLNMNAAEMVAGLGVIGLIALFVLYKKRRAIIFFNRKITVSYKYMRNLFTDPLLLLKITVTSLISQLMYFSSVYVILHYAGVEFSFVKFMAIMPVITIISSLPVGYGGWGIREGAFVYGLGLIGIPTEIAFMAGIQTGIVGMLTAFIAGIPCFIHDETQSAVKNLKNRKAKKRPSPQAI